MKEIKIFFVFTALIVLLIVSGCSQQPAADQPVKNIETFARLYGYVKYFYPGDEAAAMDWDRFAVYGVKKVETAKNTAELKKALEELFLPIAPAVVLHESGKETKFDAAAITPPDTTGMKVISWQHYGVRLNTGTYRTYMSSRVNRRISSADGYFGEISRLLNAVPYRGKEIKLKAAVKMAEGKGQLFLRVLREGGRPGFLENMADRPIQTPDWNHYEITGKVDRDAEHIQMGCILYESGKLWTDDFQLFVKEEGGWKPVPLENPGFEDGTEQSPLPGWTPLYGYFSRDVTVETAAEGKYCVRLETGRYPPGLTDLFEERVSFGEHIAEELGCGLSCIMPLALYGTDKQTYPPAPGSGKGSLVSAVESEVPKKLSGDDKHVRLAGIVISWNVFQHFFPYFDVVGTDWKAMLPLGLKDAYGDKTELDFLQTLRKFTAPLKDGHVRMRLGGRSTQWKLPFICEEIEGRPVIVKILDKTVSNVQVGDVIKEISGKDAITAAEELKPYISAATDGWLMHRTMSELLKTPGDSEVKLKLERDGGEIVDVSVKPLDTGTLRKMSRSGGPKSKILKEGIYYLKLPRLNRGEIEALIPELEKAKAIICDMRGYPSGAHLLIAHLLKEDDTSDRWMRVPRVIYPDYKKVTFTHRSWLMKARKPRLTAKVVFIINGREISYAESCMGFIEHYKLATIVGQPTAGTNGNVNPFFLPGGYNIAWTGMRVVKHDGSQFHGVGIIPDVPMTRTIEGVRAGRDEFLEKAVEIADQQAAGPS